MIRENLVQIRQLQVLLHLQIEQEASREVTEGHKVANRFHDVPAKGMEGPPENEGELSQTDATSRPKDHFGLSGRHLPIIINLCLRLRDFDQKIVPS